MRTLGILAFLLFATPALAQEVLVFTVSAQTVDSVTIVVLWSPVSASNGQTVTDYEIESRTSTSRAAVEDYTVSSSDRELAAHDTVTGTQFTYTVARPECCSPLYVGVRIRGHMMGVTGPWTPVPHPVVTLTSEPLTIPQVPIESADTLGSGGGDPLALVTDTVKITDLNGTVLGSVWVGAPDSIVGTVHILTETTGETTSETWDDVDGVARPHDLRAPPGSTSTLCAFAYVTKTWDDGNDYAWAHNWGLVPDERLLWVSHGAGISIEDWRTANGWIGPPCGEVAPGDPCGHGGMETCVEVRVAA
jgi:hypothetical protein